MHPAKYLRQTVFCRQSYDISFLWTNAHVELYLKHKPADLVI